MRRPAFDDEISLVEAPEVVGNAEGENRDRPRHFPAYPELLTLARTVRPGENLRVPH